MPAFPVHPRTKKPSFKGWKEQATDDGIWMFRLFARAPEANVGLLMGGEIRPGVFVFALDVDPRNGGNDSIRRLLRRIGRGALRGTATALTGGGGHHYLMAATFSVKGGPLGPEYPGLDIKGVGGYIVVAPSIHPDTGREYRWLRHPCKGIAKAPRRLVTILKRRSARKPRAKARGSGVKGNGAAKGVEARSPALSPEVVPPPRPVQVAVHAHEPASSGTMTPRYPPAERRAGETDTLTAEVIGRFVVPSIGHRWHLMRSAVASMIGRGYADAVVREVLRGWYDHYHAMGRIGTAKPAADRELDDCIRGTRANPDFAPSAGGSDYRARCKAIQFDEELTRYIRSGAFFSSKLDPGSPGTEGEEREGYSNRGTRINDPQFVFSLLSERECAFVEALVVYVRYKMESGEFSRDGVIRATDRQITEIASDRHPEIGWGSNVQIEREKRKYIGRPGEVKPATKVELLRERRKGKRRRGESTGTPSEYVPTGILSLIRLATSVAISPDLGPAALTALPFDIPLTRSDELATDFEEKGKLAC